MTTFYRLLGFLRPYRRGLASPGLLASLAMVMTVLIPYLTGRAVEAIQRGATHSRLHELAARAHDRHVLLVLALVIVAAVLVRWVLTYLRRMIAGRVSLGDRIRPARAPLRRTCSASSWASSTASRPAS